MSCLEKIYQKKKTIESGEYEKINSIIIIQKCSKIKNKIWNIKSAFKYKKTSKI
jgi:hypothetical protein